MAQKRNKKTAIVQCAGGCHAQEGLCSWGCTGCGSCIEACRLHAISMGENGVPSVNRSVCVGCGLCAKACPKGLIRIAGPEFNIYPACVNEAPGAETRKACSVGCIACGICVKNCPVGAIHLEHNHAVIDEGKCIACGMCAVKCPRGIILDADGIFTEKA